jgi:chorismate synthase
MSFSFGRDFKLTVFGESHGTAIGGVIEGCPAGLRLTEDDLQRDLDRRKPAQLHTTSRMERDLVRILSGTINGRTDGGAIALMIANEDVDSSWYEENRFKPRPSHADFTAFVKYRGQNDYRGGGFFSGRLTAPMVMGGAIAKKILSLRKIKVLTHIVQIGSIRVETDIGDEEIENAALGDPMLCADSEKSKLMAAEIEKLSAEGDSVGGTIECRVLNLPVGIGEPIFDSIESVISHGVFSIPGVKAIEFGSGFKLSAMRGSRANDEFCLRNQRVVTKTNNSGGILGGLTSGMPVIFRVGVKPTSSIRKTQRTVHLKAMEETELQVRGRHDPCIALRAAPVVESITSIGLTDLMIRAQVIGRVVGD